MSNLNGQVLTRDDFLGGGVNGVLKVDMSEIFGEDKHTYVLRLSGKGRDEIERMTVDYKIEKKGSSGFMAKFASLVCCDTEGNRLFKGPDDVKKLQDIPAAALNLVMEAGMLFNGMGPDAEEEIAGN
jgi:hypothetical protein